MLEKVGEVLLGFALKRFEKDAKARELSLKIQQCIKVGELEKARECCIELMGLRHDNHDVYSLLATVQYELKEYDKCLKSLQVAIGLQSFHSYWELKGDALKALDRHQEAVSAYNQAIKLNPSSQGAKQKRDACQAMLPSSPSPQPTWLRGTLENGDFSSFSNGIPLPSIGSFNPNSSESAKGIYYHELEKLLKNQEWCGADRITAQLGAVLMLEVAHTKIDKWMPIKAFPCEDLRTIDRLWVHYSNSKFGFSIQKNLWLECGGEIGKYDSEKTEKFGKKVGWYHPPKFFIGDGDWRKYTEFMNDTNNAQNALPASLPALFWIGVECGSLSISAGGISSLAQRLVNCSR